MKFRKKPVVVEAELFDGGFSSTSHIANDFSSGKVIPKDVDAYGVQTLEVSTLEGKMVARVGDWIIKGVNGEFYPCKPDIFEKTYEPAE
jgi:hypothetical protein